MIIPLTVYSCKTVLYFCWLKTRPAPSVTPVWQTVGSLSGPSRVADSSLAFLERWGPLGTTDKQMRPGRPLPSALGLASHLGPVRVALPHSPKDHWYAQALLRRQRGDTVGSAGDYRSWVYCHQLSTKPDSLAFTDNSSLLFKFFLSITDYGEEKQSEGTVSCMTNPPWENVVISPLSCIYILSPARHFALQ